MSAFVLWVFISIAGRKRGAGTGKEGGKGERVRREGEGNVPASNTLSNFSPIAKSCTLVQTSGPLALGTRNVQAPPHTFRRSSHTGRKPCLKR